MIANGNPRGRIHIGKPEDREPQNFHSRTIAGKTRLFGIWPSERAGKLYDEYQGAIAAAETLEANKRLIAADENLTDKGKATALLNDALPLLEARRRFQARAQAARDRLVSKALGVMDETLKGYDVNTASHTRLIEAFAKLSGEERARLFASESFVKEHRELALAVYAEPPIVTKIDSAQREHLREALLSDSQRERLQTIDREVREIATVERAYETARTVTAELTGLPDTALAALEDRIEVDTPSADGPKNLANGGTLKLEDDDETEA